MDISALSYGELQKLRTGIEREIEIRNKKYRGQTIVEIKSIVAEFGLKFEDVMTNSAKHKPRKNTAKVVATAARKSAATMLYLHPDNPQLVWSGGCDRPPQWIKEWKGSGRSLSEARVITE